MNLLTELRTLFAPALTALAPDPAKVSDYLGMVKPSGDPKNGDYQANFAMAMGKTLGRKPQDVAADIVAKLPKNDLLESATVAGPGFINLKLSDGWIAKQVQAIAADDRLGVAKAAQPKTFVIDLSGPNVAKPLHVGHLRSTIIGDALVRILRFLGHTVIGDNHLGDWGTQFGILIYGYKHHLDKAAFEKDPVRELARLYVHVRNLAKVTGEEDEGGGDVMEACRQETAKLHAGDPENVGLWKLFMPACLEMLRPIYERLDVKIDHALGESFYNPMLAGVVEDLLKKGIAVESNGAVVVPNAKGIVPKDDEMAKEEPPALIRKRDGAFTYTTTDMATIKYRVETWKPDVMLYVVDARQALHFKTLFANARRWGYSNVEFHHVAFGSILGKDKKPIRTRDGGTVELSSLLDEAAELGLKKYEESYAERKAHGHDVPELTLDAKMEIANAVGIGAVKYADLSGNRVSDYVFDTDKMLSTEGNTATYMQYAYARCRAIFRKGEVDFSAFRNNVTPVLLTHPAERALALQLLKFEEVLANAAAEYLPHYITQYLWDVAKAFSGFFEGCPVLTAPSEELKQSRLLMVDLTGRVIHTALGLLGIRTVERM
jgi:arginyl-tRNA synthetase